MTIKSFKEQSQVNEMGGLARLATYAPADEIQPVSKQSLTYCHSFPFIFGIDNGIIYLYLLNYLLLF